MPNYHSSYSGTQVDNAVAKALSIPDIDPETDVGKFVGVDENGELALLDAPSGGRTYDPQVYGVPPVVISGG